MTPTQLSEIRSRLEKATPGPWIADDNSFGGIRAEVYRGHSTVHGEVFPAICHVMSWPAEWGFLGPEETKANRTLISNAPTDIALLLAEVERLTAENLALQRNWVPERYQSSEVKGQP